MAVEIPVVVDIEGAFQEAAKRAPKAMEPLKRAIDGLNEDLSVFREMLNSVPVGSKDFQLIAKEIQNISQAMDVICESKDIGEREHFSKEVDSLAVRISIAKDTDCLENIFKSC